MLDKRGEEGKNSSLFFYGIKNFKKVNFIDKLTGVIERITFQNEESGWSVIKLTPFNSSLNEEIAVTLYQVQVFPGATVELLGEWVNHPKYGKQFKAHQLIEKKPATSSALEKYLGSGLIFGVGPVTAKRIVSHFKNETLNVFENDIDRLIEVEGIAKKKLESIKESWIEHREIRNVMMFLQDHGISTLHAIKIFKQYGDKSITIVKENPYRLAKDIYGIGFFSADKIALKLGIGEQDDIRIISAIHHILLSSSEEGHCYLHQKQIIDGVNELLNLKIDDLVVTLLLKMICSNEIKEREIFNCDSEIVKCYYAKKYYYDELYVADKLLFLIDRKFSIDETRIQNWISRYNQKQPKPLSDEQASSVASIVGLGVSVLTGGPGVGKTTTTKTLVNLLLAMKKKVVVAAPTGRAAQRLEEVISLPASTIHRLLKFEPGKGKFKKCEEDPLEGDFFILDECSMLDINLMSSFLKAIPRSGQLLFIGDVDQLPSVGAGNVLKDIIDSNKIKVHRLTQIFRQEKTSLIIKYAYMINSGEYPQIETPFKNPNCWKDGIDVMFVDSDEATQEEIKFIHKIKGALHQKNSGEEKRVIFSKDNVDTELFLNEEQYHLENVDKTNLENAKEFTIPKNFFHVDLEKLINTQDYMEKLKLVLKRVSKWSSINYGLSGVDMVVKLYQETIPKYLGKDIDIQILTPMSRGNLGTNNLNKIIQDKCNPKIQATNEKELIIGDRKYRIFDRVIQKKNNYDLDVFNGDIGRIVDIDLVHLELAVKFFGKNDIVIYKKSDLIELDLAYAITIHKSQGSEFPVVIIPIFTQHFKMLYRNLIYTGLTRGKKLVIFVGSRRALSMAVKNVDNRKRQTYLKELLL